MTFGSEFYQACISTFSTPMEAIVLLTTSAASGVPPITAYELTGTSYVPSADSYSTWTVSSTTTLATGLAIADPVVVAWQEENFQLFPSEYVASLTKRFEISIPSATGSSPPQTEVPSPGLSSGAKAGVGIGIAVLVVSLMAGAFVFCIKRRRQVRSQSSRPVPGISEMDGQDHEFSKKKWWAGGKWRSEVDTSAERQELDSKTVHVVSGPLAELDGAEMRPLHDTEHAVFPR